VGLSAIAVMIFSRLAPTIGMVDVPGGRKHHGHPVPLVGGLAIFAAFLAAAIVLGLAPRLGFFLLALSIIIAVGLWDDVTEIAPRVKLAIQVAACALMIWGGGVQLQALGDLFGVRPIGLWMFSIPLTVFAVVGVVNAVNMMDGMDGLAGCTAFWAFGWYAIVAADSGLELQFNTALILCGSIAGFLLFNMRFPWQKHARVFLGDAGSLMIGFALAWYAIDLTQGAGRSFPPIAALWVLLLPLADCVSVMARRVRKGRSPFVGDRHHIHHYLLARGYTHSQTLAILTALSITFGAVGYFGWRFSVPEALLFWIFAVGFFAYHSWIGRQWRRLELDETNRRKALDMPEADPEMLSAS
jgi:UDP-GlcNAc:undecaprenyl-phosphate GlcNAc-1-phosphate transferase